MWESWWGRMNFFYPNEQGVWINNKKAEVKERGKKSRERWLVLRNV